MKIFGDLSSKIHLLRMLDLGQTSIVSWNFFLLTCYTKSSKRYRYFVILFSNQCLRETRMLMFYIIKRLNDSQYVIIVSPCM